MRRALFLDRDGIVDELVQYDEYEAPRTIRDLRMIEGVTAPLRRFADAGWLLFLVTNQPNVAKGKATRRDVIEVNDAVVRALEVPVARSYICFHQAEDGCVCRKPSPYFLHEAEREFDLDLGASWMVGDQDSDLLCGRAAGCKVALIEHPSSANKRGNVEPGLRVNDLEELATALIPTSSA